MDAIFERRARRAYEGYKRICEGVGVTPVSFRIFVIKYGQRMATALAERVANKIDVVKVYYIAISHRSAPEPGIDSVTRKCAQCQLPVWIHRQFIDRAENSKGIICDICVPELTGKTMSQVLAEQIARVT